MVISNRADYQIENNNFMNNNILNVKSDKKDDEDGKYIYKKSSKYSQNNNDNNNTYNIINYNNDNNTFNIINYNSNYDNNSNIINKDIKYKNIKNNNISPITPTHYEKSNNKIENKEQTSNNFLYVSENIKINDLVLGADFKSKKKEPAYNLSQAYLLIKGRGEELLKVTQFEKNESKFNQLAPPSLIYNSRNKLNNCNNSKMNNKECFYNSSLKKDKLRNIGLNQNINFNLTNKESFNKKNFRLIFKDNQNRINDINIENKDMFKSYNNLNHKNLNNSNILVVNHHTNNNSPENNKLSYKGNNRKKKLPYSFSDKSFFIKSSSNTPNYKEYSSIDNDNSNLRNKKNKMELNAKETLNYIKPFLIKKFKDI